MNCLRASSDVWWQTPETPQIRAGSSVLASWNPIAVHPVGRRVSVKWPTSTPGMLVKPAAEELLAGVIGRVVANDRDAANTRRVIPPRLMESALALF